MDTYTVKEVAKMMNTSEETVRRWIRSGKLKANMNSRKKGSVITDAMLREFAKNTPKYATALATPIGGIVAASTLLLGTLVAKNVEKGEVIKNSTVDSEEIKKILKENLATVYKGNIIKNLIMDCQSYTKYRPNETTGGIFCIMAEKGGTSHGGLTEKLSPFFHAKKQEVNAYGR